MEKLTYKQVEEIFDNTDLNITGDKCFKGLLIISKYFDPEKSTLVTCAVHDEICSVKVQDAIDAGMNRDDFSKLAELHWFLNEYNETLSCFV